MTNLIIKFRLVFIFFVFFFLFNTSPSLAVQSYNHNTAGFVIEVPTGWELNITLKGMELSHKESLLSFEYLGNSKVDVVDIIDYFLPKDENNSTFTGVMIKVQKPYPGLRTTITDIGYTAEIAVLNTPVGYYLLSLEQEKHNITNKQVFEKMLENFTLLDTQPFNDNANFLQPVNIGSLDVYVPQGELELQANSFIWKSDAAGLLSAEIVTQKQNQPLIVFLDDWENNMLASKAGLERRTSKLLLSVDDRKTIIADYTGKDIQARVHISKINEKSVILLALITLQKTFASHEQLLDTACFSIILPEQPTNNTENTTTTEKTENKLNISSNISPVVNPAIVTKPKKKAGSGSKSNLNSG
ncbi:hypothetical protein KAJ27_18690, partial [bacterium]|nr:hypothetical protein [bacterium]